MESKAADAAFRKFLHCAHREQSRLQVLMDQLKPLWKSLHEYDDMYSQVTKDNADTLLGEDEYDDSILIHLRMKLEIARQDDLTSASKTVQEMRSIFHSVRCALVQLEYDLDALKPMLAADEPTNLRPSYGEMRETCHKLLQGLCQDVGEVDYVLEMLTVHRTPDPSSVQQQFPELLLRFLIPLRPYLAGMGVNLSGESSLPSTPKSSRVSLH